MPSTSCRTHVLRFNIYDPSVEEWRCKLRITRYVRPSNEKGLINGSWFDVVDILEGEIQHGVLLQGDGVRLAQTMRNLLIKDDVQTKFLIEAGTSETSEVRFSSFSTNRLAFLRYMSIHF